MWYLKTAVTALQSGQVMSASHCASLEVSNVTSQDSNFKLARSRQVIEYQLLRLY